MDIIKSAIDRIKDLEPGEVFLVKDLFAGYEWKRYDIGTRRTLGILFLEEVKSKHLKNKVRIGKKNSANQQLYSKI